MKRQHTVWTWHNKDRVPVYVGWGKVTPAGHPAALLFERSRTQSDDALLAWLSTQPRPPHREDWGAWGKREARELANAIRARFRRQGIRLLQTKPFRQCVGGGSSRSVVAPNGRTYGSVRLAADLHEVNPSTVRRWCVANRDGWHYSESFP